MEMNNVIASIIETFVNQIARVVMTRVEEQIDAKIKEAMSTAAVGDMSELFVKKVIQDYDFTEKVEAVIDDYDFSSTFDHVIDDYDMDDKISDWLNSSDYIKEDQLQDKVRYAVRNLEFTVEVN